METMEVELMFTEPTLGTSPGNEKVYWDFIGSKAPNAATVNEEVASLGVSAVVDKGKTVFPKLKDGTPFLWDYQLKGFFKGACSAMKKVEGSASSFVKAYRKDIDQLFFVEPRKIPIRFKGATTDCQRPLRAQTMQGERVSLAISEEVPAFATIEFTVIMLADKVSAKAEQKTEEEKQAEKEAEKEAKAKAKEDGVKYVKPKKAPAFVNCRDLVHEWLDYGKYSGIGQWRNSGKGRCRWREKDKDGNVIAGNIDTYNGSLLS